MGTPDRQTNPDKTKQWGAFQHYRAVVFAVPLAADDIRPVVCLNEDRPKLPESLPVQDRFRVL